MAYRMCYPCIACGEENSAPRPNCRCSDCSAADQAGRLRRYRERVKRGEIIRDRRPPQRRRKPSRRWTASAPDMDITRYRAEKANRVKLGPADDFAELRLRLLALDDPTAPKRGRPRKGSVPMQEAA